MKLLNAVAVVAALATPALADSGSLNPGGFDLSGALDRPVAPIDGAVELVFGGGYAQGVGGAGTSGHLEDLSGPGGSIEAQVGVRIMPSLTVGGYGTFARYRRGEAMLEGNRAWGASAGVQATWHARPTRSLDPWISLGAGWRALWLTTREGESSRAHGVELARVQLGIDYRVSRSLALAPVIGASASMFLVENTPMTEAYASIHDNRLNLYAFTGVFGRFDVGG